MNDKNDFRTPKKGNLSSYIKAGQPSGKLDSWTLSEKSEKVPYELSEKSEGSDFCSKMSESTMAIGARKNGSQYFIPIVEETPAENWADLVAEFSTTKCHSGIFRRQIERVFPLYRVCSKLGIPQIWVLIGALKIEESS